ncbi:small heat shock protein [Moniliophthora roreri MCA 2997]|uniref:Small heat shock protein n=1 Tax=Moniliophthora roreri (strain MCA 2997) TaxID=1381753 RepID=V2YR06_MONRO|nr:small heat shock protein [Moniliophthora roreri MCA 2997]
MIQASTTETALVSRTQQTFSPAEQRLLLKVALDFTRRLEMQRQQADMRKKQAKARSGREFWIPRVDIFDNPDSQYIVGVFEVPGVRREDVSVSVVDGKLIIEGKRTMKLRRRSLTSEGWDEEEGTPDCTSQVQPSIAELRYGKFRRDFVLPEGVNSTHVRVLLEHGMLNVQWPRDAPTPKTAVKRRSTDDSCSPSKRRRKSTDAA